MTASASSRPILLVTGIPGAGKTSLAGRLASGLSWPLLSLDSIKETLFTAAHSPVNSTAPGSGFLRRAAEQVLWSALEDVEGGAVVDIWVSPGRDDARLRACLLKLNRPVLEVLCVVPPDLAARRYAGRVRSGPHRPPDRAMLASIRELANLVEPLGVGHIRRVNTDRPVDVRPLLDWVRLGGNAPREEEVAKDWTGDDHAG
jgi:predicted kinase